MAPGQAEIHCHYIGINGGNHMQYSNGFSKTPYRNVKTTVCPKIHEGTGSSSQKITKQRSPPELWWREIIQMMMIVNITKNLGPNLLGREIIQMMMIVNIRLVQTCPDLSRLVQTCSDLSRIVQTCPDMSPPLFISWLYTLQT